MPETLHLLAQKMNQTETQTFDIQTLQLGNAENLLVYDL
jgi:hypothetical protein